MEWKPKCLAGMVLVMTCILFAVSAGLYSWRGQMDRQCQELSRPSPLFLRSVAYLESVSEQSPEPLHLSIAQHE